MVNADSPNPDPVGELLPRPDPTRATLAAQREAIERLEGKIETAIAGLKELHLMGLAATRELLDAKMATSSKELARIEQLGYAEQRALWARIDLGDKVRLEMKSDNSIAVDAALSAAKQFVLEQNAGTKEQLVALARNWETGHSALQTLLDDVKTRVAALEAIRLGGRETNAQFYLAGGALLTVIWIAITILALFHR